VILELIVEHHAGIPLLMKPLRGNSNDKVEFGQVVDDHISELCGADQPPYLVADSALYSAENLNKLAQSETKWLTRVPATLNEVQGHLAQPDLASMTELTDGYRYRDVASTFGAVAHRWLAIYSEARQKRLQKTVDNQLARQSDKERTAFKALCAKTFVCEPDARQALEQFKGTLTLSRIEDAAIGMTSQYPGRGRPRKGRAPSVWPT
jgi:transposase